jgi:hypothetical protein
MRNFGVYLEDKKVGTVANGETTEYEVKTGKYKLNSKID